MGYLGLFFCYLYLHSEIEYLLYIFGFHLDFFLFFFLPILCTSLSLMLQDFLITKGCTISKANFYDDRIFYMRLLLHGHHVYRILFLESCFLFATDCLTKTPGIWFTMHTIYKCKGKVSLLSCCHSTKSPVSKCFSTDYSDQSLTIISKMPGDVWWCLQAVWLQYTW